MFEIRKHKTLIRDLHKIVDNRLVLFNDGDNDVIFTGTNIYGNRLLYCIMYEEDEEGYLRYLGTVISEQQYSDFLNQKVSFKAIIDTNQTVFLIDYNYSYIEIDSNIVSVDEIPSDFLPLQNSICPDFIFEPSFHYSISMEGGLADLHKSKPQDLSNVSSKFSDFFKAATNFLHDLNLESQVYIEALKTGSFKINYSVEILEPSQTELLASKKEDINDFLNSYLQYFFNDLPQENLDIFQDETVESKSFKALEKKLENLYSSVLKLPEAGVEHKLIDLINYSVNSIKDLESNDSYNSLKVENISASGNQVPMGIMDETFIDTVKEMVFNVDKYQHQKIILIDNLPQEYKLRIYKFSNESGKGGGYFENENGVWVKVIVHARGKENYGNTLFTKSLDEEKFYTFKGIGTKVDGVLKKLVSDI